MIRRFSKIITRITFEYLIKSSNEFLLYFKILAVIIIIEPSCSWQLQLTSWGTWHGLDIVRNFLKERRYTKKNEGISILCFEVLEQKIESFLKVLFSLFRWTSIFCFETEMDGLQQVRVCQCDGDLNGLNIPHCSPPHTHTSLSLGKSQGKHSHLTTCSDKGIEPTH